MIFNISVFSIPLPTLNYLGINNNEKQSTGKSTRYRDLHEKPSLVREAQNNGFIVIIIYNNKYRQYPKYL